jgi:hypothetical protein
MVLRFHRVELTGRFMTLSTRSARTLVLVWGVILLFGVFLGLCSIFALVTTAAGAWYEHVEMSWPQTPAVIKQCRAGRSFPNGGGTRANPWLIECRIAYAVNGTPIETEIDSATTLSSEVFASMSDWVELHKSGATLVVRYDPANHSKVVLTATDMPIGGPRTPGNLQTLLYFAFACAIFLVVAGITRPSANIWDLAQGRG